MSLALARPDLPASPLRGLWDDAAMLADPVASYAGQTRAFLGIPADIAFALNGTAAAVIAAMLKRCGISPPEMDLWHAEPAEPAEITLLSVTCRPLARITFDVNGAAAVEIEAWLERALGGYRLLNFGVDVFSTLSDDRDIARRVAARLWDTLAGRRQPRLSSHA